MTDIPGLRQTIPLIELEHLVPSLYSPRTQWNAVMRWDVNRISIFVVQPQFIMLPLAMMVRGFGAAGKLTSLRIPCPLKSSIRGIVKEMNKQKLRIPINK
jgi:hypothetical protein